MTCPILLGEFLQPLSSNHRVKGSRSGASPKGGRVTKANPSQGWVQAGEGRPGQVWSSTPLRWRDGLAKRLGGGVRGWVWVCVYPYLSGVRVLVLNGSWVHGEWIWQRCHLTLRFLSHLNTEDNVHWSFFTGPLRRWRNRYRTTVIWKVYIQASSCTPGI